jgi:hypothetical protein
VALIDRSVQYPFRHSSLAIFSDDRGNLFKGYVKHVVRYERNSVSRSELLQNDHQREADGIGDQFLLLEIGYLLGTRLPVGERLKRFLRDFIADVATAPLSHTRVMVRVSRTEMGVIMSYESRVLAGILLVVLPTVRIGGVSILSLLIGDLSYMENPLRQDLWRAGHAHAGVWLIPGACGAALRGRVQSLQCHEMARAGLDPHRRILVPAAFFLSVLSPDVTAPNGLIYLAYAGAVLLAVVVLVLGVGLVRRPAPQF